MLLWILVASLTFGYVVVLNATTETVVIGVITIFTNIITAISTFYYTSKKQEEVK